MLDQIEKEQIVLPQLWRELKVQISILSFTNPIHKLVRFYDDSFGDDFAKIVWGMFDVLCNHPKDIESTGTNTITFFYAENIPNYLRPAFSAIYDKYEKFLEMPTDSISREDFLKALPDDDLPF